MSLPSPGDAFDRGARLFDRGAFFEAHEAWEERWLVETDETLRRFFQGLIQIAAGFHKRVAIGDRASAARLLAKGLAKLESCPEGTAGVALGRFCAEVGAYRETLAAGGSEAREVPKLGAPGA